MSNFHRFFLDFVTALLKKVLFELSTNCTSKFLLVASHERIPGNELADKLTKIGRDLKIPLERSNDKNEFLSLVK